MGRLSRNNGGSDLYRSVLSIVKPTAYWDSQIQAATLVDGAVSSLPDITGNGNTALQGTAAIFGQGSQISEVEHINTVRVLMNQFGVV